MANSFGTTLGSRALTLGMVRFPTDSCPSAYIAELDSWFVASFHAANALCCFGCASRSATENG